VGYHRGVGFLARIWAAIRGRRADARPAGGRRPVTTVELLQRAERARRAGHMAEAEALVTQTLRIDPRNGVALLLSGYLHAAARRSDAARTAFRTVLAMDPDHPRAMLGLAKTDLEAGDVAAARELLERALRFYPDFPEARALLDVVRGLLPGRGAAAAGPLTALQFRHLALPPGTRECMVVELDGTVLFSHPVSRTRQALADHLVRVAGMASAALGRAGLGAVRRGAIRSNSGTTFLVSDSRALVALTLPPDAEPAAGLRETEALWTRCMDELGAARPARG
jgi:tetratricopeptide (TPR) repeat protein